MFDVNFNSLNRDVYILNYIFATWRMYIIIYVNKIHFLIGLCMEIYIFCYDVGKVIYKYCTSTFPISSLTIID